MAKAFPPITIEEIPGEDFPDLVTAQRSARATLAADVAQTIKNLIELGRLEIINNQIRPKGK